MNLDFYNLDVLEKEIEKLPPLHRIAFAALICERLLPNYGAFYTQEEWGNPIALRTALDEVWQILQGQPVDTRVISYLQSELDRATPDADYVTKSQYIYEAQEACSAIEFILEACLDPTPQSILKVAKRATDTIDAFITCEKDTDDPSWAERQVIEQKEYVTNHPFAIREIAKQKKDLQRLREVETLDQDFLESLRASFNNSGRSLIYLS
ncbi:MAG TPA: DUF416 family protein [Kamptonema sp.]|nr:DUF416 family protein [Kamptonema sp.]